MTRPNARVTYIDKGAVAAAMAEEHRRRRKWSDILGWVALCSLIVSFWWWALFC